MKRREFTQAATAATAIAASTTLWSNPAQAQQFAAGTDYMVVDPRAPVEAPAGKIEVVEFFWYNCPHCNTFEPMLTAWIKKLPKDVVFRRVPVQFRDDFVPQQRLFYALEAMGLIEKLHAKVFVAIHVEKKQLVQPEVIGDWVATQGVNRAKFMTQYNSFSVASKAAKGSQLQNSYKVEGVPSLGVAGRFYTDGSLAKNMERALQVVDALVSTVRTGK